MHGRRLLVAFGAWTLFVWATRVGTAFEQDELTGVERAGRVGLALSFTLVGLALLVVAWRSRARVLDTAEVLVIRLAALWTVGVWLVRSLQIPFADHEAAFVAVHLVLAVVSVALAVATVRSVKPGGNVVESRAEPSDRLAALGE